VRRAGLPEGLGTAVRRELARLGPGATLGPITEAWADAVGPAVAANAWPARVSRDGTLHIATASSAWAFELTQLESTVRERLRERLGDAAPPKLAFAVGRLAEPGAPDVSEASRTVPIPTEADRERAAEIAAAVADSELREAVARAAAAGLAAARSGTLHLE
jgi:hypothetical protein